jgi:general secretion pathway protein N
VARRSRLLSLGLLVFLAGAILFFPARVGYDWFAPPELKLSGIRGSIWQGNASEASLHGVYLRELHWQIRPWQLLTATLAYSVKSKFASGFLEADVAAGAAGVLTVSNLSAAVPLAELQPVLGMPGIRGNLSVQVKALRIKDGLPIAADGDVTIAGLAVPFVYRDALGDFRAEFFTQDAAVVASLEEVDALIDLAGSLQISADRNYRLLGQLGVTDRTPVALRQYLGASLGTPDARGRHEFRLEGVL